jgi:predicted nucleic acid-binding protein
MNGRFFLDTNIFVYTFDRQSVVKAKRAADLVRDAIDTGNGIVSYQVVQEFFNVAFRRFEQPMTTGEAEQYLLAIFRPLLAVQSSPTLYFEALHLGGKHRLAWYDSLIVAAALEGKCDVLYSEDLQHGRLIEGLKIENPFL